MKMYIIALLPLKDGYATTYWRGGRWHNVPNVTINANEAATYSWDDAIQVRDVLRREPGLAHPDSIVVTSRP